MREGWGSGEEWWGGAVMKQRTAESRLAVLRQSRSLPPGAGAVGDMVRREMTVLRSVARRAVDAIDAWTAVAPPLVARLATAQKSGGGSGGGGGVLMLTVGSVAARFQVDRWLRGGGLAALRAADPKITSVRIATGRKG